MRNPIEFYFERNCNLLLDFFGSVARPLSDDLRIGIGDVRIGFDGQVMERDNAPDKKHERSAEYQQSVTESKVDQSPNHSFCSASPWKTAARPR